MGTRKSLMGREQSLLGTQITTNNNRCCCGNELVDYEPLAFALQDGGA